MATDIYLTITNIPGDSEDYENKDAIEIQSFADGFSMPVTSERSFAGSGTSGIVQFGDFTFTKLTDSATPHLLRSCWGGEHHDQVVVKCYRSTGPNKRVCYLEIVMEGCVITNVQWQANNGGLPQESVSINYSKIKYIYKDTDHQTGKEGPQRVITYDRVTNKIALAIVTGAERFVPTLRKPALVVVSSDAGFL